MRQTDRLTDQIFSFFFLFFPLAVFGFFSAF